MPRAKKPPPPPVDAQAVPEKRGPGRPPKAAKQLGRKAEVDALVEAHMPKVWVNLRTLADGKAQRVEEVWEAAGTVTRKDIARDKEGNAILDKNQKPTLVEVLVFPDLPATQMVKVGEKVVKLPADFKANEHIWNRFGGRPAEEKGEKDDDLDINKAVEEAHGLTEAYDDPDDMEATADGGGN